MFPLAGASSVPAQKMQTEIRRRKKELRRKKKMPSCPIRLLYQ